VTSNQRPVTLTITLTAIDQVHSTYTGNLDLSQLPKAERYGHVIPGLANYALLFVVKLCKAGVKFELPAFGIGVEVRKRGRPVLTGWACTKTGI
jgi:hypothetical protein